jgi:DNA-binding NarL/FixJ family response regulator
MIINVIVASARQMVVEGISRMVEELEGVHLLASVSDAKILRGKLKEEPCQLLLLDFQLPGAQETMQYLKVYHPEIKIILLLEDELTRLQQILQAHALGYLQQTDGKDELEEAIRLVATGQHYSSEAQALGVAGTCALNGKGHLNHVKVEAGTNNLGLLSKREIEILKMIGQELSSPEIATQLFLSVKTVETHRRNIMKKLGAKNLIGLLKYALREGLLE